ncbi:EscU/YscU/HrcU family type III secretion system export apparatus switch protein [Buchnera aphidicola]|uniref:Flagellar biosynthetic protein FlhB n=1 Tax=Buchnera aphidicola (Cinara strobi) TaxID=1921549 RepID=A0A3B1DW25_9GAMM|nr:EscU/YscU/HrcU family type III secretion system export apparatus switch protein [Buchnera aphidicola]VAX76473.1 Flagellar biosynthetic protein FlhB [Buchnera aphidicola (Cinara strobi)]
MSNNSYEDKTEEPTPHKIKKFKDSGETRCLYDLNSFFILLFFFLFFYINKKFVFLYFINLFISSLTFNSTIANIEELTFMILFKNIKIFIFFFSIFFFGILSILVFLPTFIYGKTIRIRFLGIRLIFLNFLSHIKKKNFFSSFLESVFIFFKIFFISMVIFYFLHKNYILLYRLSRFSLFFSLFFCINFIFKYIFILIGSILVIAIINTLMQYIQYLRNIRMTIQEVKEEYKELEGNPLVKQRIGLLKQKTIKNFIVPELVQSDIIIFNSVDCCAVAIKYNTKTISFPKVVSKGLGNFALRIIKIAKKNNIPIFFSKSLAVFLYYHTFPRNDIPDNIHKSIVYILSQAKK